MHVLEKKSLEELHSDSTAAAHTHNLLCFKKVQEHGKNTRSDLNLGTALVSGLELCEFLLSPLHRSSTASAGWKKNQNNTPICGLIDVFE